MITFEKIRLFIRLSRPLFLLGGVLFYALGISMADYLGVQLNPGVMLLGLLWVFFLQLSSQYLNEYFDAPGDLENRNRTFFSGGSGAVGKGKLSRTTPLFAAATALTLTASTTVVLLQQVSFSPLLVLIMVIAVLGGLLYSVPPFRLATSGYGELTTSILVANLVPSFAFTLQFGELHRLVAMGTFSLTLLHLAMMVVFEFPDYAADIKYEKLNLLVRIGWERSITLHNMLILCAYLLLGLAMFFGLPIHIALPALFTLPLGLLEIWQLRRIAAGGKPNWNALGLNAIVLLGSMAYLLAYAFWTR
jgi:1,4-dihydroxy-2-naphthoate octaprenyltransferase